MTLITYPTRVHFADHVLEEALQSELERVQCHRLLLTCDRSVAATEMMDRVMSGIPGRIKVKVVTFGEDTYLRGIAQELADPASPHDTIVAFGSARAVELGRKCRYAKATRGRERPELFAIPAVDGLPNPCRRNLESTRAGLPSVLICDPTVTLSAAPDASYRASVLAVIRCVESYLAQSYNPPADGMALDGLTRCVESLPHIADETGIDIHREVMAACLNAALSQEKGIGPAQALSEALVGEDAGTDQVSIARLVLPGVMRVRSMDHAKADVLRKVLGDTAAPLDVVTERLLSRAPLPGSLSDLGVSRGALDPAAEAAAGVAGLTFDQARDILDAVYEDA
ncbi:MAG: iron-containing alcohol dehydrogenase [Pseudomonadota bacterium]